MRRDGAVISWCSTTRMEGGMTIPLVTLLAALCVAGLRRSGHKVIARWAAVALVCWCVVVIAIGLHEIVTGR
jgi:hypothetical protein